MEECRAVGRREKLDLRRRLSIICFGVIEAAEPFFSRSELAAPEGLIGANDAAAVGTEQIGEIAPIALFTAMSFCLDSAFFLVATVSLALSLAPVALAAFLGITGFLTTVAVFLR